jgi:hypothetical protein
MTTDEIDALFTFISPTSEQSLRYDDLRKMGLVFAKLILQPLRNSVQITGSQGAWLSL